MYEFTGFSQRLQELRKKKKMTQEDLADRMGVTGQAVSKWENNQSYPDITIIPNLVTVLGTEIDYLFGKKSIPGYKAAPFPDTHEGLPLVHSAGGVACYSDKTVAGLDETGVKFTDGSSAELSNRLATNVGSGEITFLGQEYMPIQQQYDPSATSKYFEFGPTENIDIAVLQGDFQLTRSTDGKTYVRASGHPQFIQMLRAEEWDKTLKIYFEQQENCNLNHRDNQVVIEVPYDAGQNAKVSINGSGSLKSDIAKFHSGSMHINGSGSVSMKDFELCTAVVNGSGSISAVATQELKININGSGAFDVKKADKAQITVNGSGDVNLGTVTDIGLGINGSGCLDINNMTGDGDFSAKISGSGSIDIKGGNCRKFDVDVSGSGDIDATGLTARNANIILHEDGEVTLGRVIEGSTEQVKKKGRIRILKRGA